ncbi:DUF362 domain-containing protein [Calditerrivibrio sp.]|jgi:uncharacterized protein (DUF362 family)|uniref:DUF362 domain-containing protein n=1 Tax=Calditerrivibrio sp. TaxID=2792612 RepID=UPI003D140184
MKRREFIKLGITAPLVLSTPSLLEGGAKSDVYIAESANHRKAVVAAIEMMGGIDKFIKKGDRVAIKPNMAWAREPMYAANTNPEVVAEVVKLCYRAGAKEVYVTDNPCDNARTVFNLSQIPLFAQKENAEVFIPQSRHYENMNIGGTFLIEWPVLALFKKVDKVINIPVAKNHSSSKVTVGMKNWMGAIGGNRGFLHQNLHQAIYELAVFFKPTLTLIDCTRIMLKGGPSGGDLNYVKQLNRLIATNDFVAGDSVASEFLGVKPDEVGYLTMAARNGHGQISKANMNIRYEKI